MVPDAAWPGSDQWPWSTAPATGPVGWLGRPSASDPWGVGSFLSLGRPMCVQCPWPLGSCSPMCPRGLLCCVCGVLGHLAPVHRCARSVCCVACAVSWATWPPVHRCARSVCRVACAVSRAIWLLFTGAPAQCVALRVRCPAPLGSCSPVCPLGVLCCVCGVLGHLAPVTCVPARFVVLCLRCPGPLGSCSPVCPLGVLFCVCGVLGPLAPAHRCARSVCCVACAVFWATWLLLAPRGLFLCLSLAPLFSLACFALFFLGEGGSLGCCAWVWVCAGAGAGVGVGVTGDGSRVAVALWVPCVCVGPRASGFHGAGPGGADGGWFAAVVAWRLQGWSRLLGSAWVAWPGAGARVGVFMAWADGVVGSVGVAGLCGCRVCVRRTRGGLGWGTVGMQWVEEMLVTPTGGLL